MDYIALLTSQLMDLFRIGLSAGLFFTMERTRAQTGVVVPLLAGVIFIAAVIATTMPKPGFDFWTLFASGVVANSIIVAVFWLIWSAVRKRA